MNSSSSSVNGKVTIVFTAVVCSLITLAVAGRLPKAEAGIATECGTAPSGYNVIVSNASRINGTAGRDFICAGHGDNLIVARGDDDIVYGRGGNDRIYGQLEPWGGTYHSYDNDKIYGGSGDDVIHGQGGNDVLSGGSGDDNIKPGEWGVRGHHTYAYGGPGDDVINGSQSWSPLTIHGGRGNDRLTGGYGSDIIAGNVGNDILKGGDTNRSYGGNYGAYDVMIGGPGNDVIRNKPLAIIRQ